MARPKVTELGKRRVVAHFTSFFSIGTTGQRSEGDWTIFADGGDDVARISSRG